MKLQKLFISSACVCKFTLNTMWSCLVRNGHWWLEMGSTDLGNANARPGIKPLLFIFNQYSKTWRWKTYFPWFVPPPTFQHYLNVLRAVSAFKSIDFKDLIRFLGIKSGLQRALQILQEEKSKEEIKCVSVIIIQQVSVSPHPPPCPSPVWPSSLSSASRLSFAGWHAQSNRPAADGQVPGRVALGPVLPVRLVQAPRRSDVQTSPPRLWQGQETFLFFQKELITMGRCVRERMRGE